MRNDIDNFFLSHQHDEENIIRKHRKHIHTWLRPITMSTYEGCLHSVSILCSSDLIVTNSFLIFILYFI